MTEIIAQPEETSASGILRNVHGFVSRHKSKAIIFIVALAAADMLLFAQIGARAAGIPFSINFLSVGQGDASLVALPTHVRMLIDGGPPGTKALEEVEKFLSPAERYLDLVVMSHPQADHFGGLIEILKRYRVGAFLMPARDGEGSAFAELKSVLAERGVRTITVGAGDVIVNGGTRAKVLSPTPALLTGKTVNDAAIVMELEHGGVRSLFTSDASAKLEASLLASLAGGVDILKVAHHGSKYSSGAAFLNAVRPKVAVIEVGKNSYGHPTPETLARLAAAGAKIFRTDEGGVTITADGDLLHMVRR